jgi:hypothetical protein
MVFLQGTALMHRSAVGKSREERVRQVVEGEESVRDFASYLPVEDAPRKLRDWARQGAEVVYLSSHTDSADVETDRSVLRRHGFPEGPILYRRPGETYADVAESWLPDVLIEDDCGSIGGGPEMTYPHLRPEAKARVRSVVIKEFGGFSDLPDDASALASAERARHT